MYEVSPCAIYFSLLILLSRLRRLGLDGATEQIEIIIFSEFYLLRFSYV